MIIATEADLIGVARALIDDRSALSSQEAKLLAHPPGKANPRAIAVVRGKILAGADPLGDAFCRMRSPAARRATGATYTPRAIVCAMVRWAAAENVQPTRVVDPGAGSGRFLIAAAGRFPLSWLVAVEVDPLAALLLRANAGVLDLSHRLEVRIEDFRKTTLRPVEGTTLFVGNPPYVRHHGIGEEWKAWFAREAHERGLKASKLAGLHVHFFLKTLLLAQPGDLGAFVTAAEWLDVNYGSVLRSMLADGLGGSSLHVLDPAAMPFEDATTTAAITCFKVGNRPEAMRVRSVSRPEELNDLSAGLPVSWARAVATRRWSILVRGGPPPPKDRVELGELFHVHRGQVTGANAVWIHGDHSRGLPRRFLMRTVTRAKELLAAGEILREDPHLRLVIDLPADLDALEADERLAVERFLAWARVHGADRSYIARHRRVWWSVGLKPPAPILCTYMARRPPAFVHNLCGARHLNIAHGLYPRQPISDDSLRRIASWLSRNVHVQAGRTYAGGLTKFEPGEVERIPVPDRWQLAERENAGADVQ